MEGEQAHCQITGESLELIPHARWQLKTLHCQLKKLETKKAGSADSALLVNDTINLQAHQWTHTGNLYCLNNLLWRGNRLNQFGCLQSLQGAAELVGNMIFLNPASQLITKNSSIKAKFLKIFKSLDSSHSNIFSSNHCQIIVWDLEHLGYLNSEQTLKISSIYSKISGKIEVQHSLSLESNIVDLKDFFAKSALESIHIKAYQDLDSTLEEVLQPNENVHLLQVKYSTLNCSRGNDRGGIFVQNTTFSAHEVKMKADTRIQWMQQIRFESPSSSKEKYFSTFHRVMAAINSFSPSIFIRQESLPSIQIVAPIIDISSNLTQSAGDLFLEGEEIRVLNHLNVSEGTLSLSALKTFLAKESTIFAKRIVLLDSILPHSRYFFPRFFSSQTYSAHFQLLGTIHVIEQWKSQGDLNFILAGQMIAPKAWLDFRITHFKAHTGATLSANNFILKGQSFEMASVAHFEIKKISH